MIHAKRSLLERTLLAPLLGASLLCAAIAHPRVAYAQKDRAGDVPAPSAQAYTQVVNLNTANEVELEALPGIGPSRARAIIQLRTRMGGFKRIAQIMRVRGIGRKTFRTLRPMLQLAGKSTPKAQAK